MARLVITPTTAGAARGVRCDEECVGLHTYVADGRRLCWRPDAPGRHAIDAEQLGQAVPDALGRRHGIGDFWSRWTRTEALAKLTGTPITAWLSRYGLDADAPAGVRVVHHVVDDLIVAIATAA